MYQCLLQGHAESHFPTLPGDDQKGIVLAMFDTFGKRHNFRFRYWINNASRMYAACASCCMAQRPRSHDARVMGGRARACLLRGVVHHVGPVGAPSWGARCARPCWMGWAFADHHLPHQMVTPRGCVVAAAVHLRRGFRAPDWRFQMLIPAVQFQLPASGTPVMTSPDAPLHDAHPPVIRTGISWRMHRRWWPSTAWGMATSSSLRASRTGRTP